MLQKGTLQNLEVLDILEFLIGIKFYFVQRHIAYRDSGILDSRDRRVAYHELNPGSGNKQHQCLKGRRHLALKASMVRTMYTQLLNLGQIHAESRIDPVQDVCSALSHSTGKTCEFDRRDDAAIRSDGSTQGPGWLKKLGRRLELDLWPHGTLY
jgi:hypothetical protein